MFAEKLFQFFRGIRQPFRVFQILIVNWQRKIAQGDHSHLRARRASARRCDGDEFLIE